MLPETFESSILRPGAQRRSLLSPVLEAVRSITARRAILAGTSLSMLEAIKTSESGLAAGRGQDLLFGDLPAFDTARVASTLNALLALEGVTQAALERVSGMLRGRARFTTAFVEHVAVDHPNDSLDAALASFVARMTGDASDPYTTRRALETLHKDGRSNTITYWNGEDNIKAEDLWVEFVSCALNEVHGFAAHKLEKDALPALVEVGLRGTRPDGNAPPLEPLVLETARVALLGPQLSLIHI